MRARKTMRFAGAKRLDVSARRIAGAVLAVVCLPIVAQTTVTSQTQASAPTHAQASASTSATHQAAVRYGLGAPLSDTQIKPWNIDVAPDGDNLPAGSGQLQAGRALYAAQCASCHGARGEGGLGDALAGGQGTLASAKPLRTVGSYWPYATTLYDYIRRAMPLNAPQSLTDDEVYAVTGYVLHLNGLAEASGTFDREALLRIVMPNVGGFVDDPRPDLGTHARRP